MLRIGKYSDFTGNIRFPGNGIRESRPLRKGTLNCTQIFGSPLNCRKCQFHKLSKPTFIICRKHLYSKTLNVEINKTGSRLSFYVSLHCHHIVGSNVYNEAPCVINTYLGMHIKVTVLMNRTSSVPKFVLCLNEDQVQTIA